MIDLSIIIPCFNEDKNIAPLFDKIENLLKIDSTIEIIIVNNGSTDYTKNNIQNSNLFIKKKIKVCEIKKNIHLRKDVLGLFPPMSKEYGQLFVLWRRPI